MHLPHSCEIQLFEAQAATIISMGILSPPSQLAANRQQKKKITLAGLISAVGLIPLHVHDGDCDYRKSLM